MRGFLSNRAKAVYVLLSRNNEDQDDINALFMLMCGGGPGSLCRECFIKSGKAT